MSRGPGRIERALAAIFDTERDNAFTIEDLCERIWPQLYPTVTGRRRIYPPIEERSPVEKKHRISVARAARNLAKRRPEIQFMRSEQLGGGLVFFRHDEVMAYAMARLKADNLEHYRSKDPRLYWTRNEAELRDKLADERHCALVGQGGAWRRHVDIFLAERDGDVEKVARLEAENAAALEAWARSIRRP